MGNGGPWQQGLDAERAWISKRRMDIQEAGGLEKGGKNGGDCRKAFRGKWREITSEDFTFL